MYERLKNAKLFVSDMDGTVYLGDEPIDGAVDFVNAFKGSEKRLLFFTNNASRTKGFYTEKLKRLGFGECEVMTSGDVTINYIKANYPKKTVFLVGTEDLKNEMLKAGICITDSDRAEIVVSSFDTELTYKKLQTACDAIRAGALYICTHPDLNCPLDGGRLAPDSGAIEAFIEAATGKAPIYLGKPYKETSAAISDYMNVPREYIVCVGDRLYTDVALAKNSGMVSVLVLSGETGRNDITERYSPDFVFDSVRDIIKFI